jgi:hypothetical protein
LKAVGAVTSFSPVEANALNSVPVPSVISIPD